MHLELTEEEAVFIKTLLFCGVSGNKTGTPVGSLIEKLSEVDYDADMERQAFRILLFKNRICEGKMHDNYISFSMDCGNINYNDVAVKKR